MTPEEARKFQDEWLASRPKWGEREDHPLIVLANEAYDSLPQDVKRRLLEDSLRRTPTERLQRYQARLKLLFAEGESCQSREDLAKLLYGDWWRSDVLVPMQRSFRGL